MQNATLRKETIARPVPFDLEEAACARSIEQLDEILADVRQAVDDVAERIVTIGGAADGLPATVAAAEGFAIFPKGLLTVDDAIGTICDDLGLSIQRGRKSVTALGEADVVSQDLAVGVVGSLEKHHWMLRAQREL